MHLCWQSAAVLQCAPHTVYTSVGRVLQCYSAQGRPEQVSVGRCPEAKRSGQVWGGQWLGARFVAQGPGQAARLIDLHSMGCSMPSRSRCCVSVVTLHELQNDMTCDHILSL